MLRQFSAALIAVSMMVAPALAADAATTPAADRAATPHGKMSTRIEMTEGAKHVGHKHRHHAGSSRHHSHTRHVALHHHKQVNHVVRADHAKPVAKAQSQPVTTRSGTATPAAPSRTN